MGRCLNIEDRATGRCVDLAGGEAKEGTYFPALPALTTDYKAVRQDFSLIILHWFRLFPALKRLVGKRRCKFISKSQSAISSGLENLIFLAGKTPFQGSKDGERADIARRNAEPAVRVNAGSEQVSVQDLDVSETRKRLKASGQCRKCSFSNLHYFIFSNSPATASMSNGKSSTLCNLPSRPKTMLVGKP